MPREVGNYVVTARKWWEMVTQQEDRRDSWKRKHPQHILARMTENLYWYVIIAICTLVCAYVISQWHYTPI
jgi:hypothetical protein